MRDPRLAVAILLFLASAARPWAAAGPLIPVVPGSGPGAVTLLIHSGIALPYSLMDLRGVVERLLSRVDTRIVTRAADSVNESDVRGADYVVLLGIEPWPAGGPVSMIGPAKPLLVCGLPPPGAQSWPGGDAFRKFPPEAESWQAASVSTGSSSFPADVAWLLPAKAVADGPDAGTLARVRRGEMTVPLAWRSGKTFWFAALPLGDPLGFAFSGILPSFFGLQGSGTSGIVLAVEDLDMRSDPATLRRIADMLAGSNIPFVAAVRMPGTDADQAKAHAFVTALQYAQARRGRIFLIPQVGQFWDVGPDRPPSAPDVDAAISALREDFVRAVANGLFPVGVRLPESGLSASAAARVGESFSLGLAIAQASDATALATFSPGTITRVAGTLAVIPASPWFQPGQSESAATARNLLRMPGMVLHVAVPGWMAFRDMGRIIEAATALDAPFLDAADAAVSVSTGRGALWTAAAGRFIPDFSGRAILSSYDARAQLVSSREIDVEAGKPLEEDDGAMHTLIPCEQP